MLCARNGADVALKASILKSVVVGTLEGSMFEKRPRAYAAEILQLKTIEERRAALASVPGEYRDRVELYVRNEFERRKYSRRA